jgi:hypothetical protein
MVDYKEVLSDLRARRLEIEKAYKSKLAQLDAGIAAIEHLVGTHSKSAVKADQFEAGSFFLVEPRTYAGMTVIAATHRVLENEGKPMTAPQIVARMLAGGFRSKAKVLRNSVYSSMFRDDRFLRLNDGRWSLKAWKTFADSPPG